MIMANPGDKLQYRNKTGTVDAEKQDACNGNKLYAAVAFIELMLYFSIEAEKIYCLAHVIEPLLHESLVDSSHSPRYSVFPLNVA
jgi:hypothetical protein